MGSYMIGPGTGQLTRRITRGSFKEAPTARGRGQTLQMNITIRSSGSAPGGDSLASESLRAVRGERRPAAVLV